MGPVMRWRPVGRGGWLNVVLAVVSSVTAVAFVVVAVCGAVAGQGAVVSRDGLVGVLLGVLARHEWRRVEWRWSGDEGEGEGDGLGGG